MNTFTALLLKDLQANEKQCNYWVEHSVGIITALLPHVGYEQAAMTAKEAYLTGRPVREIILEKKLLSPDQIGVILEPSEMTHPGIAGKKGYGRVPVVTSEYSRIPHNKKAGTIVVTP